MYSLQQLKEVVKNTKGYNFANLVDKDGHSRFIEGNGSPIEQEGAEITYCKWSLSGTHLMCVLAGNISNSTVIANNTTLASFTLPSWVSEKIYPVFAGNLEIQYINLYASDWTKQSVGVSFAKLSDGKLRIRSEEALTLTADRGFRIQFDLLIDNN